MPDWPPYSIHGKKCLIFPGQFGMMIHVYRLILCVEVDRKQILRVLPAPFMLVTGGLKMKTIGLLIAGQERDAADGRMVDCRNPITGAVVTRSAAATPEDARAAVAAAASAFPHWSALSPEERRKRLNAAADVLEAKLPEFIALGVAETGAVPGWIGFNVNLAANILREAAALTTQVSGEVIPSNVPGSLAMAIRQPAGVVLGIAPWNAPVILGVRALATPLACGNTVVIKASELSPGIHHLIGRVMQEAGVGDGVVNVLTNAPEDAASIVEVLISHPQVRRVNFTGSTRVGRIIGRLCGEHLTPAILELGGKAPFVVLEDADLDAAVAAASFSAFMNQGQICMSAERIVVDAAIADAFVAKLAHKASSMSAGDPAAGDSMLGSLVSVDAARRCRELIDDAIKKGAVLAAGGGIDGAIMQPTVLDKVTPSMRIYAEESFGAVVTVVRAQDESDAIRIANDTEYGLSSAVFSGDAARGYRVAAQIQTGICHINGPTVHDEAQMPFGGVNASGYGRFGGRAGIHEFTDLRWITLQHGPRHYPI